MYGRKEFAKPWMRDSDGMIIFGSDSWKKLTGDEWNSYKLFLWQIRYKFEKSKKGWSRKDLKDAVEHFVDSYYGNDVKKLRQALKNSEFKKLEKALKK